jgi:D-amino-acid dehydrogenase
MSASCGPVDVAIVGGGAVGACAALELATRGAGVVVVDRASSWGQACSWSNAGGLVPSHVGPFATTRDLRMAMGWLLRSDSPFGISPRPAVLPWLVRLLRAMSPSAARRTTEVTLELARRSVVLHEQLADSLDTGRHQAGLLDVYETTAGWDLARRLAGGHAGAGLEPRVLSAAEVLAEEPNLDRSVAGGILFPNEAHCDPRRFTKAVGASAEAAGATLRPGTELLWLQAGPGGVVLQTTTGRIEAGAVVIAAGAWSKELARPLGARLPLEGGKGYTIDLDDREMPALRRPLVLQESRVAVTPMEGRLRLAGAMVFEGLHRRIDPRRVRAIRDAAARCLPSWSASPTMEVSSGLRPCTPDGVPMIGWAHPTLPVAVATGHAMLGLTLAPITGQLVADLLEGRSSDLLRAVAPDRFAGVAKAPGRAVLRDLARPPVDRAVP